jgi:hypothetical protein
MTVGAWPRSRPRWRTSAAALNLDTPTLREYSRDRLFYRSLRLSVLVMSKNPSDFASKITSEPTRSQVVNECDALIDSEVRGKGGLGGVALRGAYATIKAIKPGFISDVVDALLDEWVDQLEPYHQRWKGGSAPSFAEYLTARSDDVAEDLLKVTDERASTTKHATARKAYQKLRGSAKRHVIDAIPKLGRLLERHANADVPEHAA